MGPCIKVQVVPGGALRRVNAHAFFTGGEGGGGSGGGGGFDGGGGDGGGGGEGGGGGGEGQVQS